MSQYSRCNDDPHFPTLMQFVNTDIYQEVKISTQVLNFDLTSDIYISAFFLLGGGGGGGGGGGDGVKVACTNNRFCICKINNKSGDST